VGGNVLGSRAVVGGGLEWNCENCTNLNTRMAAACARHKSNACTRSERAARKATSTESESFHTHTQKRRAYATPWPADLGDHCRANGSPAEQFPRRLACFTTRIFMVFAKGIGKGEECSRLLDWPRSHRRHTRYNRSWCGRLTAGNGFVSTCSCEEWGGDEEGQVRLWAGQSN
jgi:hypothetical protein